MCKRVAVAALFGLAAHASGPRAEESSSTKVELKTTPAGGVVSQIEPLDSLEGGNVAASIGSDGILLVDAMNRACSFKLKEELERTSKPVRVLIDTHFHFDHTAGNMRFGDSATIIAHENTRKRLADAHMPGTGLPILTYTDTAPTLHFNGEVVRLLHCPNAHTDGDTVVVFENSKVVHMGDLYFAGMFPAVYRESGGDWPSLLSCLDHVLPMLPADAAVIPGHGHLSNMRELREYVAMLKDTTAIVQRHLAQGETAEQMSHKNILARYAALGEGGAQTTPQYIAMLVKLLSPPTAPTGN